MKRAVWSFIILGLVFISFSIVSASDLLPNIKANGSEDSLNIIPTDNLSVTVSLDPGSYSGQNADWWIAADTPSGCLYFDVIDGSWSWKAGLSVTYQGPLFNFSGFEVLNISNLSEGIYTFYFGADTNMNGELDEPLYYDNVVVNVDGSYNNLLKNSANRMAQAMFDSTYKTAKVTGTMSFSPFSAAAGIISQIQPRSLIYTYGCASVELQNGGGIIRYNNCYGLDGSISFTYDFSGSTYVLHYNFDLSLSYGTNSCEITGPVDFTMSYVGSNYTFYINYGDTFYVCGEPLSGSCLITYNASTGKYTFSYDLGEYTGYYNGQIVTCDWNTDFTYDGQCVNGSGIYSDDHFTISYAVESLCYNENGIPTGGKISANFTSAEKHITYEIEITGYSNSVATYSVRICENGQEIYSGTGQYRI